MNEISLLGRLTADPVIYSSKEKQQYVRYTLAVSRNSKDNKTDFIPCVAFDKSAEFVSKHFKKGNRICVVGTLQSSNYEKDGQKLSRLTVITQKHYFADSKKNEDELTGYNVDSIITDDDLPFEA